MKNFSAAKEAEKHEKIVSSNSPADKNNTSEKMLSSASMKVRRLITVLTPMRNIPTLAHHQQKKENTEVNELIGGKEKSMNEKLQTQKKEIGAALHDAPVRDLSCDLLSN